MDITKIPDVRPETADTEVTLKIAGNVSEIRWVRSLTDIPIRKLTEAIGAGTFDAGRLAEVESRDGTPKSIIKGARLRLYPPGLNIYRHSRGVKLPEVRKTTEAEALAAVGDTPLTYEKTISITDEAGEVKNIINYRTFTKGTQDNEETGG